MNKNIDFNEQEAYLIKCYLDELKSFKFRIARHAAFIFPMVLFGIVGIHRNEIPIIFSSCVLMVSYVAYFIYVAERYADAFKGIITKYENYINHNDSVEGQST